MQTAIQHRIRKRDGVRMFAMDIYSSPPGQGVERDLASTDARRFTQIESMSLTRHSFKSSKPLKDIL